MLTVSYHAEERVVFSKELQETYSFLHKVPSNENAAFCTHCKSTILGTYGGNGEIKDDITLKYKQWFP